MAGHCAPALPLLRVTDAHAKAPGARLQAAADHEAVAGLKHMQRAGQGGVSHGADEHGHTPPQAARATGDQAEKKQEQK